MTAIAIGHSGFEIEEATQQTAPALPNPLRAFIDRRRERRLLVRIARLSPHMIRDIGFEPESVYAALEGSWDEVAPGAFRHR